MKNNILFDTYNILTPKERLIIHTFLSSDKQESYSALTKLWEYLELGFPFNKQELWSFIFPTTTYKDGQLRQLMHQLLKIIKEQLICIHFKDNTSNQIELGKLLMSRGEKKLGLSVLKSLHSSDVLETYLLNKNLFLAESTNREYQHDFKSIHQDLEIYYLVEKLKWYCIELSKHQISNFNLFSIENPIDLCTNYQHIPTISMYILCIQLYTTSFFDVSLFNNTWLHYTIVEKTDQEELVAHLINYLIKCHNNNHSNIDKQEVHKLLFMIFNKGIQDHLFNINGYLNHHIYRNIMLSAIHLNYSDWIEHNIPKYGALIHPDYKSSYINYTYALYYSSTKKTEFVIKHLKLITYIDDKLFIDAKFLLIKTYYSNGDDLAIHYLLNNLKKLISKTVNISKYHKDAHLNALKYISLLINCKSLKKAITIQKSIEACSIIAYKDWLQEQIKLKIDSIK